MKTYCGKIYFHQSESEILLRCFAHVCCAKNNPVVSVVSVRSVMNRSETLHVTPFIRFPDKRRFANSAWQGN